MSKYRLTENQEKNLNLIPVTWALVRKMGAKQVYIKAHSDSPTYGPYLVKDPLDCVVCKLDGTEPRYYPRDKGLFVSQAMSISPTYGVQNSGAYVLIHQMIAQHTQIIELLKKLAEELK
jgi:hypothetical protein